ncbi:hypothetical protein ACFQE8_19025 [Salinirubellus sp. GCM10025818]|uniref:hypothetical protein n=1 Tax=Salinirubellus TaxID=2162630 RepID=UPI0030CD7FFA
MNQHKILPRKNIKLADMQRVGDVESPGVGVDPWAEYRSDSWATRRANEPLGGSEAVERDGETNRGRRDDGSGVPVTELVDGSV